MSLIKAIKAQLGLGPAAENHFWDGSVPNQLSLKRGTPDVPGSTVMQVVDGVLQPVQTGPAFSGIRSTNQPVTSGVPTKIVGFAKEFEFGACFANDVFKPSVPGLYLISLSILANGTTLTTVSASLSKGVSAWNVVAFSASGTGINGGSGSALINMNGTTDEVEAITTLVGTDPFVQSAIFSAVLVRAAQ